MRVEKNDEKNKETQNLRYLRCKGFTHEIWSELEAISFCSGGTISFFSKKMWMD